MSTSDQRAAGRPGTAALPRTASADHARRRPPRPRPHRAARAHHRAVRHLGDRRPAAGRPLPQRGLRGPDGAQERPHGGLDRRRRRRRGHLRGRGDLHPARRRRAHRHLEHGRDDPDDRLLRHRAAQPGLVLLRDVRHLCAGRDDHRQFLDHRGHPGRRLRRHGARARSQRGDGRRRDHLRRLLRRQDDPAVGDDHPGPEARGPRADGQPARAQHVLDRGTGHRHQPGDLLLPRAERRTERRSRPRPGAGGPRAVLLDLAAEPAAAGPPDRLHVPEGAAVPGDPRVGPARRGPRAVHAGRRRAGLRRRCHARSGRHGHQGRLRRHGHRLRQRLGEREDRRTVLPRRDGEPAHDRLAGARRARLRRDPRAGGLPAAPARAGRRRARPAAG